MATTEFRKQISIFIPLSDWRALRAEAARRKIPITELCRQWMTPGIKGLPPVAEISTASTKPTIDLGGRGDSSSSDANRHKSSPKDRGRWSPD